MLTTVLQAKFLLRVCLHTDQGEGSLSSPPSLLGLPHITEVGSGTQFSLRWGLPFLGSHSFLAGKAAKGVHSQLLPAALNFFFKTYLKISLLES